MWPRIKKMGMEINNSIYGQYLEDIFVGA